MFFSAKKNCNRMTALSLLSSLGFIAFFLLAQTGAVLAAVAPGLGTTSPYGIVSNTSTNANTAPQTIINGKVCCTTCTVPRPLTITGGAEDTPCPPQTGLDQNTALGILNGQLCTNLGPGALNLNAVDIGGGPGVFTPGCYYNGGAMNITAGTTVTLNGSGVYIFRPGGALTTEANTGFNMAGGSCESDVYWAPVGATTIGATSAFVGNIFDAAGISLGHFTSLTGRALDFQTTVTTDANTITVPTCAAYVPPLPLGVPTLGKAFSPATIDIAGTSTLTITLSNPNLGAATLTAALIDTLPTNVVIAAVPNAGTTCGGAGAVTAIAGGTTVTLPAGRSIPGGSPGTCTVTVDVTGAVAGSYINTLDAGALQTSNGNNTVPAIASLTVNPALVAAVVAPTVSKSFSPVTISAGGTSTLTIVLSNSSTTNIDTITTLTDNLPSGMTIAAVPGAATTCAGGVVTATAGTSTIILTGGTIPVAVGTAGTCTVTVNVTSSTAGSLINTLAIGGLVTDNGINAGPAIATLIVIPLPATSVPTLNEWGMMTFMLFAGLGSLYYIRKYRRV